MTKHLIVVGRTRENRQNMTSMLANALNADNILFTRFDGAPFPINWPNNSIVAYFSSKERFPSVLSECLDHHMTLIVATSGIKAGVDVPNDVNIPVIIAENLSPLVMGVFKASSILGDVSRKIGAKAFVAEGHQASKTSAPATAQKIAGYFGNPPESVGSIRSDPIARAVLGIPEANLGGFGAHFMVVSHNGTNVRMSFDTQGRSMYYDGLKLLLGKIEEIGDGLKPGIHEAHEVLFGK
jgi:dihydrodipicolinate reductase